jgi:hypothetical protein
MTRKVQGLWHRQHTTHSFSIEPALLQKGAGLERDNRGSSLPSPLNNKQDVQNSLCCALTVACCNRPCSLLSLISAPQPYRLLACLRVLLVPLSSC